MEVLFHICTLTWSVNNYVSRQGKGINRRNENTITNMIFLHHSTDFIEQFCSTQLTVNN